MLYEIALILLLMAVFSQGFSWQLNFLLVCALFFAHAVFNRFNRSLKFYILRSELSSLFLIVGIAERVVARIREIVRFPRKKYPSNSTLAENFELVPGKINELSLTLTLFVVLSEISIFILFFGLRLIFGWFLGKYLSEHVESLFSMIGQFLKSMGV